MSLLKKRLPPMGTLAALEAAYRHGSFTRAADELALSQASVSRQIRDLEKALGVQLFERRRHDVCPTDVGKKYCDRVIRSLMEIANASDEVRPPSNYQAFTVLSDLALASAMIAPLIGEFSRLHPEVHLRVLATFEPIEAVDEEFDIGIQSGQWATDRFDVVPVADDVIFPVCSPELAHRLPDACGPADLLTFPLLHLAQAGRHWYSWGDFLAELGVSLPSAHEGMEFSSYDVCLDVAAGGEGIALAWARSVHARISSGQLVRIPGLSLSQPGGICLYWNRSKQRHPLARQFAEFFARKIDSLCDLP